MSQFSTPIDAMIDGAQKRTSQRAELIAACYGLRYWVREQYDIDELLGEAQKRKKPARPHGSSTDPAALVVATDSEYAVKGMTEWLPKWKDNNYLNSRWQKPANLDLFLKIDDQINEIEALLDLKVGFWHISRRYNELADRLAKEAAEDGEPQYGYTPPTILYTDLPPSKVPRLF